MIAAWNTHARTTTVFHEMLTVSGMTHATHVTRGSGPTGRSEMSDNEAPDFEDALKPVEVFADVPDLSTGDGPKDMHQCDGCATKVITDRGAFPPDWELEEEDDDDSAEHCPECQ